LGRFGGVVSLQKGAVRAPLGRGYAPRPSHRGATANPSVQDYGSVASGKFSGEIVAKETSVLTQFFFGSSTGHDARRSSHAHPEDSFPKSTSLFVQVRPIHNLVRFRCSCSCKKLMQTFLCLLRDTISRSFTEMFLATFQSTVPEKDAQIYELQTSQRVFHAKLQDPPTQYMARSPPAIFVGIASRNSPRVPTAA